MNLNIFDVHPTDSTVDAEAARQQQSNNTVFVCIKISILATNFIFLIFGIVLLAVSAYWLNSSVSQLSGSTLPIGILCLGVFTLMVAVLGASASWKESAVGLLIYLVILLLISITLFSVGIAIAVSANNSVSNSIISGWNWSSPSVKIQLETSFACCGLMTPPLNLTSDCPPPSVVTIPVNQTCLPLFVRAFQSNSATIGGCGIAFAILMITGIILVIQLLRRIYGVKRNKQQITKAEEEREIEAEEENSEDSEEESEEEDEDEEEETDEEESSYNSADMSRVEPISGESSSVDLALDQLSSNSKSANKPTTKPYNSSTIKQ